MVYGIMLHNDESPSNSRYPHYAPNLGTLHLDVFAMWDIKTQHNGRDSLVASANTTINFEVASRRISTGLFRVNQANLV